MNNHANVKKTYKQKNCIYTGGIRFVFFVFVRSQEEVPCAVEC